jgi:MoaA/NifB/PqqE/SkfB family radical SAM enzyme
MPLRYGWRRSIGTAARHVAFRAAGYPTAVNLEVTRRCNARCDFCRYPQVREDPRLDDYLPVVERLKPTLLTLSGGEPLIRKDLESIIARLRAGCPNLHIGLVTNGGQASTTWPSASTSSTGDTTRPAVCQASRATS